MTEKNPDARDAKERGPTEEEISAILSRLTSDSASGERAGTAAPGKGVPPILESEPEERLENHLELLMSVPLTIRIELGRTRMTIEDVLKLGRGSVVGLDRMAGDLVNIYVNERMIARGEVVIANGNFCVRVAEILLPREHA